MDSYPFAIARNYRTQIERESTPNSMKSSKPTAVTLTQDTAAAIDRPKLRAGGRSAVQYRHEPKR
jgi:hypothetical protein